MKNPIKHLKHLIKDPINTIEEANARKKEIMPWLYGSIGVAVLFCGLDGLLGTGILMVLGMVGIVGVGLFGFLLFIIKKAKEKFAALTCNSCKAMASFENREAYEAHVTYVVSKEYVSTNENVAKVDDNGIVPSVTIRGYGNATVDINLKCPSCGAVKKLQYGITPFKCSHEEKKIPVKKLADVKFAMSTAVNNLLEEYQDLEKRAKLPCTIHSVHNPKYEERTKATAGNDPIAYPRVHGVKIDYHRTIGEMVDGFFLENELNGKIIDLSAPAKK